MKRASFAFTLLGLASVTIITGCGGSSSPAIGVLPIMVSVSADSASVSAGGQANFTATVNHDPSGKGVTWTVSCSASSCGSIPPTPTLSGTAALYTAPSAPPPSDLIVTVKATSVADTSKSGSATITVSAITVSVSPATATLQAVAGNNLQITATVNNDPSGQGVNWKLSCSASPCGSVSPLTTLNGNSTTYTPPGTPPASDLTVTVTATSIGDSTKSATVTITVPSVTISVTPPSVDNVEATTNVPNIVATVGNDPSNKGVSWTVSCSPAPCGSVSPTTTASGIATTYTAPTTPPPGDLTVTVTATSVADPAAQTSMTITVKAISVMVTPSSAKVPFGTTQANIVAVVSFDPAKKGVTWAIQPCGITDCGSISSNATASGQAISYTAPASPPANDVVVTIVATSDSDTTQTGSISITVPAITVAVGICTDVSCMVSWPNAIIPVNATTSLNSTPIKATVNFDTKNQGVTWTLTQGTNACTTDVCGTISLTTTASGTATIYSAPTKVPANPSVTITATSVTDTSKSAAATITLTVGTVKLIPAALNFGTLFSKFNKHPSGMLSTTLTNTGASVLSITSQTITGTSTSAFSVTTPCPASVASGDSCAMGVTFAPPGTGSFSANLSIADSDISSPQVVPLSGRECFSRFACFGAAAIQSALANNRMAEVPSPSGPDKVGTRVIDLVDATRSDPYLTNGAKRELQVRFWYPAALTQSCKPAQYASTGVWNYLAQLVNVPLPQVKTNSCQDAAIATGAHAVVVFTHGYTGTFTDYTFLFEDLASRGYVVASVNHTFEATAVQFPDGRVAKSVFGSHLGHAVRMDEEAASLAVAVRLADLRFVMDELERMNASPASPFAGKLDLSRVALAGHSLGGMTAVLGIELESRFRAAITIDGVMPGPLFGATEKPVLMLLAGRQSWDQDTCDLWSALHGPRLALNLKGSEHLTPSDAVWLAKGAVKTGTVGMEGTVAAVRDYIAAFLDVNLNGKPVDRLLTGASSPDVEVTTHAQTSCGEAQKDLRK